jgi:hypothetical protein
MLHLRRICHSTNTLQVKLHRIIVKLICHFVSQIILYLRPLLQCIKRFLYTFCSQFCTKALIWMTKWVLHHTLSTSTLVCFFSYCRCLIRTECNLLNIQSLDTLLTNVLLKCYGSMQNLLKLVLQQYAACMNVTKRQGSKIQYSSFLATVVTQFWNQANFGCTQCKRANHKKISK